MPHTRQKHERVAAPFSQVQLDDMLKVIDAAWPPPHAESLEFGLRVASKAIISLAVAWATGAALRDDARSLPRILRFLTADQPSFEDRLALFDAASWLADTHPTLRAQVHTLVDDDDDHTRARLARWLDPANPTELTVLLRLAADRSPYVMSEARKQLGDAAQATWWAGAFDEDPLTGLDPDEARANLPGFQRYAEARRDWKNPQGKSKRLWALIHDMPNRPAFSAAASQLRAEEWLQEPDLVHACEALAHRPGGLAWLCDLMSNDPHRAGALYLSSALRKFLPDRPVLAAQAFEIAWGWLQANPDASPASKEKIHLFSDMCNALWPADRDPWPWVELMLHWGAKEEGDYNEEPRSYGPIERAGANAPWARTLLDEALAANHTGRTRIIARELITTSAGWSVAERQQAAERVLEHRSGRQALSWAVGVIVATAAERIHQLYQDPELREIILFQHPIPIEGFALGRQDARNGVLEADEAGQVIESIGELFGGLFDARMALHHLRKPELIDLSVPILEPEKRKGRMEALRLSAPGDLSGPVTEAEWDCLRRGCAARGYEEVHLSHLLFPAGPWHLDDLARYRSLVDAVFTQPDRLEATYVPIIGAVKPAPEMVPLLEHLATSDHPDLRKNAVRALELLLSRLPSTPSKRPTGAPAPEEDPW